MIERIANLKMRHGLKLLAALSWVVVATSVANAETLAAQLRAPIAAYRMGADGKMIKVGDLPATAVIQMKYSQLTRNDSGIPDMQKTLDQWMQDSSAAQKPNVHNTERGYTRLFPANIHHVYAGTPFNKGETIYLAQETLQDPKNIYTLGSREDANQPRRTSPAVRATAPSSARATGVTSMQTSAPAQSSAPHARTSSGVQVERAPRIAQQAFAPVPAPVQARAAQAPAQVAQPQPPARAAQAHAPVVPVYRPASVRAPVVQRAAPVIPRVEVIGRQPVELTSFRAPPVEIIRSGQIPQVRPRVVTLTPPPAPVEIARPHVLELRPVQTMPVQLSPPPSPDLDLASNQMVIGDEESEAFQPCVGCSLADSNSIAGTTAEGTNLGAIAMEAIGPDESRGATINYSSSERPRIASGGRGMNPKCDRYMDDQGELGNWGEVTGRILLQEPYRTSYFKPNAMGTFCPNFDRMSDQKKLQAWIWMFKALSQEEASCEPTTVHPTHIRSRKGKLKRINWYKGYGMLTVEYDKNIRRANGRLPECNDISSAEGQILCGISMIHKHQVGQRGENLNNSGNFGPLRGKDAGRKMMPHMRRFADCGVR